MALVNMQAAPVPSPQPTSPPWRAHALHCRAARPQCAHARPQGSFGEGDIVRLPPSPLPTATPVTSFGQLVAKMQAGEIYANVHSVAHPAGEARGNLYPF